MKLTKKLIGILVSTLLFNIIPAAVYAEDVNPFPPQRPSVGQMKVVRGWRTTLALRTNGTVNLRGDVFDDEKKNLILSQTNVVDIALCGQAVVALLKNDGTVFVVEKKPWNEKLEFEDVSSWTDIVSIAGGNFHVVGLKSDGTVVAAGSNREGQCDVFGWRDVSKIVALEDATFGIKRDGTVLATGEINNFSDIRNLKNVKDVFANVGQKFSACALLADGTTTDAYHNGARNIGEKFKEYVPDAEIIDIHATSDTAFKVYILASNHNLYEVPAGQFIHSNNIKLVESNIISLSEYGLGYYAIDANGQILSNAEAFTSDDWILTTNITYNGKKINADVPPYVKNGRTLAPIRSILEALGMTVSWNDETQTATASKADITITVTINSNIATINGEEKILDVPAEITNDRTFVPVRFFGEALNMNVDWDNYTKTVIIESK